MGKTGVNYNKKTVLKTAKQKSPYLVTVKRNPEWQKQFNVVLKEAGKLNKISPVIVY